jgi:hypothetical protein
MSILFVGGEDEALESLGGGVTTIAGVFRAGVARCALSATGNGWQHTFAGKLRAYLDAQPAGDKDFWYGYRWRGGGGFLQNTYSPLIFLDETGRQFLRLRSTTPGTGELQYSVNNGVTWVPFAGSAINQPGTPDEYVFRVKIHPTLGHVEWYINGSLWYQTPNMDTTPWCVGSPRKVWWPQANSNNNSWVSEVRASSADDPCVGWDIYTMDYAADGALQQWAGSVAAINEIVKDVGTVIQTAVADVESTFVPRALPVLAGGLAVRGIVNSGDFRTAAAPAPQHVLGTLRIAGVSYPSPDVQLVSNVAALLQWIWETSPATGDEFAEAEIAPANFQPGYRSAA